MIGQTGDVTLYRFAREGLLTNLTKLPPPPFLGKMFLGKPQFQEKLICEKLVVPK